MSALPRAQNERILPRGALFGAGAVVATTMILVCAARLGGYQPDRPAPSAVVSQADLRFVDRADGAVLVYAAADGRLVDTLAPGTNGFVRGVLRGLALARTEEHLGSGPPFRLTRWADGRLSLEDPATGREVELDAFGMTNARAFAHILLADSAHEELRP
ncbi:MAG: phosphonate-binding protein [Gammaproteobacteria bacterium]|nr:phosphonate-binding protein [Gammaproteobacteria bacterium]